MLMPDKRNTYVSETAAAVFLRDNAHLYDGLTYQQVLHAHNDPAFIESLRISGCGAIHMGETDAQKQRLYVSLCHRHYTAKGMREVISAAERHAHWVQQQENQRLQEHGEFMADESRDLGKIDGYNAGHSRGIEVGRKQAPIFGGFNMPAFTSGFVDTFKVVGVVGVGLILAVVYLIFVKGKGINAR